MFYPRQWKFCQEERDYLGKFRKQKHYWYANGPEMERWKGIVFQLLINSISIRFRCGFQILDMWKIPTMLHLPLSMWDPAVMFLWACPCIHCELSSPYAVHRGDLCIYCSLTAGDVNHKPEILSSANALDICVKKHVQDKHKSLEEKMNVVKPFFQNWKLFKITLEIPYYLILFIQFQFMVRLGSIGRKGGKLNFIRKLIHSFSTFI